MASVALPAAPTGGERWASKWADWPSLALFGLMSLYGPALGFLGEFRYVEIVILAITGLALSPALASLSKWDKRLIGLFLLAALSQAISDRINHAALDMSLKRIGTYVVLAGLIVGLKYLQAGQLRRLCWIILGYSNSYLLAYLTGFGRDEFYLAQPWRLGLGFAVTLAAIVICIMTPRLQRWTGWILLALAITHLVLEARAQAVITGFSGLAIIWSARWGSFEPPRFVAGRQVVVLLIGIVGSVIVYQGARVATELEIFPEELQKKMEVQLSSQYGLLAAARPDTAAAAYAITKQPFFGYGSSGYDSDVFRFYAELSTSVYFDSSNYLEILNQQNTNEWLLGMPSHSHLLGAWVDAGFFASLCWFALLWLCFQILGQSISWQNPLAALFIFIAIDSLWNIIFSPGPHRMEVAIRVVVLTYAMAALEKLRQEAAAARAAATPNLTHAQGSFS